MATKVEAARLLTRKAARLKDAGERSDLEAGMAKLFASETGKEVVEEAFRIHGGYGYSKEYEIERLYRDAPLLLIGEGTSEIQKMVIGKKVLERNKILRVALVTGSNRGIGREIARRLAHDHGFHVLAGARNPGEVVADEHLVPLRLDVRDAESVGAALAGIEANPGDARRAGQQRRRLRCADRGRRLRPRRGPRRDRDESVRALADDPGVAAAPAPEPGAANRQPLQRRRATRRDGRRPAAYRLSKAGLNALTRTLAADEAGSGLLVNSVCPGWVRTDMGGPAASRSVEEGADTPIWLATMPDGGPTGGFFRDREPIPW